MTEKENSFEKSLLRLDEIAEKLEEGNVSLDESLTLFEEGIKLTRFCNQKLEEAKKKVEILVKKDGKLVPQTFDPETVNNPESEEEKVKAKKVEKENVKQQNELF
ncbi:MAG: exodeoxyribonuclease VII small subunit [Elusimicrobiota bacterium]